MSQAAQAEAAPFSGAALWLAALVLSMANFMVILDASIANVSVPHIAGGLAVSPTQGTWVITSYGVAEAITVPLSGWLARRFGTVKVFMGAMTGFGICSFACGFAPSFALLVFFRVLQGFCGGPIMPMSQTLLMRIFPPSDHSKAMGIWAMTAVLAPVAGPLLGGNISDTLGWNWIFLINIPVAAIIVFGAWTLLRPHDTSTARVPVDYVGLGLLVVWVGALQIMFDRGKELDWFASPLVVSLAVAAAIGFVAFLIWELTAENPIVDLRIFRHRGFVAAAMVMAITYGTYFATVVLVPLWLQTGMGYTATWAGYAMAGNGLVAVFISPIAARLTARYDPRVLVSYGVGGLALVALWRSQFTTDASFWTIVAPQLALGLFVPFFFVPNTAISMTSVLPQETASAAGLSNFMRTTAGSFFTSLMTTFWDTSATQKRALLVGRLNEVPATTDALVAQGFSHEQAIRQIDHLVQTQSVMLATSHMFTIGAASFVVATIVVWLAPAPKRAFAGGGATRR